MYSWSTSISEETSILDFAYPCDNYINKILSNSSTQFILKKIFNKKIKEEIRTIIDNSIEITSLSFPQIYHIFIICCDRLNIQNMPKCYLSSKLFGINSLTVGDDDNAIILLSPLTIIKLNCQELSFIFGHELGHMAQKNLICHTIKGCLDYITDRSKLLGPILADIIDMPLNNWHRCSEYTSDRAGLICCGNIHAALNVFEMAGQKQSKINHVLENLTELSSEHPSINNRIMELKKFHLALLT